MRAHLRVNISLISSLLILREVGGQIEYRKQRYLNHNKKDLKRFLSSDRLYLFQVLCIKQLISIISVIQSASVLTALVRHTFLYSKSASGVFCL